MAGQVASYKQVRQLTFIEVLLDLMGTDEILAYDKVMCVPVDDDESAARNGWAALKAINKAADSIAAARISLSFIGPPNYPRPSYNLLSAWVWEDYVGGRPEVPSLSAGARRDATIFDILVSRSAALRDRPAGHGG